MIKKRIVIAWLSDLEENIKQSDLPRLLLEKRPYINVFQTCKSTEFECDATLFRSLFNEGWTAYDSVSCEEIWNETNQQWE